MIVVMPFNTSSAATTTISYYQSGCTDKPNATCESSTETVPLVGYIYRAPSFCRSFTAGSVNGSDPVLFGFHLPSTAHYGAYAPQVSASGHYNDDFAPPDRGSELRTFDAGPGNDYNFLLASKYYTESQSSASASALFTAYDQL